MKKTENPLLGKRIGIFGKGGSGKSTMVVLLAQAFRDKGYPVCILDADSTNVGLSQAISVDKRPLSLIDYYGGMIFNGGSVTCPVDDPSPLPGSEVALADIPEDYYGQNQDLHFFVAGKIGDLGPGAGCDGPISKIARDFRVKSDNDSNVTLVDFKAGFEDTARGAITSLDWAVMVVDPTFASVELAVYMGHIVDRIKAGELPATQHLKNPKLIELANKSFREAKIKGVIYVLNKIADRQTENYLRGKLAEHGLTRLGIIHDHPSIALSWLKGKPIADNEAKEEAKGIMTLLEEAEESSPAQNGESGHASTIPGPYHELYENEISEEAWRCMVD